jgi:hypothetical protein
MWPKNILSKWLFNKQSPWLHNLQPAYRYWGSTNMSSYMAVPRTIQLPGLAAIALFVLGYSGALAASSSSPKLFAPGIVSGPADDLSPAFSPDGKVVSFTRGNESASTIMTSTLGEISERCISVPTVAVGAEIASATRVIYSPSRLNVVHMFSLQVVLYGCVALNAKSVAY